MLADVLSFQDRCTSARASSIFCFRRFCDAASIVWILLSVRKLVLRIPGPFPMVTLALLMTAILLGRVPFSLFSVSVEVKLGVPSDSLVVTIKFTV